MRTWASHGKPILPKMPERINEDLVQFVGLSSFKFFNIMRLDPGFLSLPVETGELDSSFNEAKLTVSNLVVVNDGAERGVKLCNDYTNSRKQEHRLTGIEIWPEPEFDRNFVNRQILLMKMTTRLITLDCAGYISTFKAVIVVTAAL